MHICPTLRPLYSVKFICRTIIVCYDFQRCSKLLAVVCEPTPAEAFCNYVVVFYT